MIIYDTQASATRCEGKYGLLYAAKTWRQSLVPHPVRVKAFYFVRGGLTQTVEKKGSAVKRQLPAHKRMRMAAKDLSNPSKLLRVSHTALMDNI